MASASTNIEQGDTQDDVFNCETQDDCGEDGGTNGSETQEASPINANGKRVTRFTQDKGKKSKTRTTLIIQETISSMAMSASFYASEKEGKNKCLLVVPIMVVMNTSLLLNYLSISNKGRCS
jgi:hypothetical protein